MNALSLHQVLPNFLNALTRSPQIQILNCAEHLVAAVGIFVVANLEQWIARAVVVSRLVEIDYTHFSLLGD